MTLLDNHLEQILLCSSTISDLPFPPPKIFTNAILRTNDITALIRDTEAYERALYTAAPPTELFAGRAADDASRRRTTMFGGKQPGPGAQKGYQMPRRNRLVNAALGGDLARQIQHQTGAGAAKHGIDVDVLLQGAERLCSLYPIPGTAEQIPALRQRYQSVMASINRYEGLVAEQAAQLGRLSRSRSNGAGQNDDTISFGASRQDTTSQELPYTEEDMRREEEGIRELERKKRTLELRLSGLEKDLGGVMR